MDALLSARRAILSALKGDVDLTSILPASSIYSQALRGGKPSWPFVIYGSPSALPIRATCLHGAEITVAVHSFAKAREVDGTAVETAEDYASRIGAAVIHAIDGTRPPLAVGGYLRIAFTQSQLLIDGGEADAFHHVANFRCRAITG